jgi:hypothetical protein
MGGCRSTACDTVARKIWEWWISRNIWATDNYISAPSNVVADSLSRTHLSDHEWLQLNKDIFHKLSSNFPKFSIDLFACLLNRQVEQTGRTVCILAPGSTCCDSVCFHCIMSELIFLCFPTLLLVSFRNV